MRIGFLLGASACLLAASASAQSVLQSSRALYVERSASADDGRLVRAIEPAQNLRRGDKVVLMVQWTQPRQARSLTVASAIPRTLAFQRSSEESLEVSVDGGRNWGKLGQMQVRDNAGFRLAAPEEVTHLRWRIAADEVASGRSRIMYSAIVR